MPYNQLVINGNLKYALLKDDPETAIRQNTDHRKGMIVLKYPVSHDGQHVTEKLEINNLTYRISSIYLRVKWRGVIQRTYITFSGYEQNEGSISENIFMKKAYKGYIRTIFNGYTTTHTKNPYMGLIGTPAPEFEFFTFSGKQLSLEKYKGRLVLLDFWESWCGYCLLALPEINDLQKKYGEKKLKAIGVVTENKKQIQKLIKRNHLVYSNIYASPSILKQYGVSARPTYFLVDQNGNIASVSTGNLKKIEQKIELLIN